MIMKNNGKIEASVKDGNFSDAKQSKGQNLNNCCDPCECGIPGCECGEGDCC
jgi:hypothetical protein